jgi:phosphoribosylanthranilate isomerase
LGSQPPFIVKVCGLSGIADVRLAEACGATHVGLIVEVARSPRSVGRDQARVLARAARATSVMVTTSTDADEIAELAGTVQPGVVQLHGEAPSLLPALAGALPGCELWPVVPVEVGDDPDLDQPAARIKAARDAGARCVLLDAARGGQSGGTGQGMSWEAAARLVALAGDLSVILAGGLSPDNVAEAVRRVRPRGVDASSGVERSPGAKSPRLTRAFCENVREVTSGG